VRSVGIGALGALALALTACGADDPAADGAGDAIVADEAQAEEIVDETEDVDPEELGGDEDDIVLTFWHGLGGDDEVFIEEELAQRYSEQTDGVVVNAVNRGTYEETLDASILAAGTDAAPHLVQLYEIGTGVARDSGVFVPLHEADEDGLFDVDDYIPAVAEYYTDETGELYSAPWNSSNPILNVDATRYEEAGLDPDDPPETFSEVMDDCDVLMAETELEGCFGMPIHAWFFEQWVAQQGELLVDNDNGRSGRAEEVLLDSDAAVTVMEWWQEMDAEGYWTNSGEREDWDDPRTLMAEGEIAMALDSTAGVAAYEDSLAEDGRELTTAFMPIPDGVERNGTIIGGASNYVVDGHSDEETEAAVAFANWLSETEQIAEWHRATGYFPLREDTREQLEDEGWFDEQPNFATALQQLEETQVSDATRGAIVGQFPQIRSIVLDAAEAALFEGQDPAEALSASKDEADRVLSDYNEIVVGE